MIILQAYIKLEQNLLKKSLKKEMNVLNYMKMNVMKKKSRITQLKFKKNLKFKLYKK